MRLKHAFILGFIFSSILSFSQMTLNRDTSLHFTENGTQFSSPLSGGINAGQFSNIDLNLDGVMDLVVHLIWDFVWVRILLQLRIIMDVH